MISQWKKNTISLRISDKMLSQISDMAEAYDTSRSEVIRYIIEQAYSEFSKNA